MFLVEILSRYAHFAQHFTKPNPRTSLTSKTLKIRRIKTMINKIRLNILKGAKPESFRFSSLNTQKITFAGFNKPRNQSKRIAA